MAAVFTITKRDLQSFFVSPRGAAIFWFFLLFMGIFFYSFIYTFLEMEQQAPMMGGQAPTLEQLLRAFFYNFHFILLLVVPAVTMSSFAEERRSQSMRLLMSSPISATQIVLGKFFSVASLMALVLAASAVFPLFAIRYGNPDVGIIWASYLGLFLLMCSQLAFGLWISSVTNNQFMSFLLTMFGLFLLLILNWIARNITGGGLTDRVVKYIASTPHLEAFFQGMITVSDVTYFVCFTALFLFFTNVALDSQRWR